MSLQEYMDDLRPTISFNGSGVQYMHRRHYPLPDEDCIIWAFIGVELVSAREAKVEERECVWRADEQAAYPVSPEITSYLEYESGVEPK